MKKILLCSFIFVLASAPARSQAFSDLVKQLGIYDFASEYLKPAADAIGMSFNSGLYHTARVDSHFHFYGGVKGIWTFIPNGRRTFTANVPSTLQAFGYPARITTATAFGDSGATLASSVKDPNGNPYPEIKLPQGINLSTTFIMLPHLTIGSFLGTEVMIRAIPPYTIDPAIGKLQFYGFGVKHSPSQLVDIPVDVAVMVVYQKFYIGDVLDVTNYNANVHASMKFIFVTMYLGIGYEGYDIHASYTYTPSGAGLPGSLSQPEKFFLDFTGRNLRLTAGVNVELIPFVDLNIDYSYGTLNNLSAGIGISF